MRLSVLLLLIGWLCLCAPISSVWAQEGDTANEEAAEVEGADDVTVDEELQGEANAGPSGMGESKITVGFTFQSWSPFTRVTSGAISSLAAVGGVDATEGENVDENIEAEEVTTQNVTILTIEFRGNGILDDLHLDVTENTDISRLNPFESRSTESSTQSNLESKLKEEEPQTSRFRSQFELLGFDASRIVTRIQEENFVSEVTPTKDSLFINFGNSEALIREGEKIRLETSFEEVMIGFSDFDIPWTEIPIGFLGYYELTFQKPILLPLPSATTIDDEGEDVSVDSVIIFPQFKAVGWMLEWYKSEEEGFDASGYLKFGHGNISIGQSRKRVNELLIDTSNVESRSLFARSAEIYYSGGLLRLSFLSDVFEVSWFGEWRVFVLNETFNGVSKQTPVSVDLLTGVEILAVF